MPSNKNNRFHVGSYVRRKRLVLQQLNEEKINALSAVKTQQQKIRRLKEKVGKEGFV
jgi:hypothetical protein